jgi:AraC-like DNA-binding protein
MKFRFMEPLMELRPYIIRLWLVENDDGFINHGTLVAPNAKPKIIIPFRNDISASGNNKTDYCKEGDIGFIGIRDTPVMISSPPGPAASIGVELNAMGAYRFLNGPMYEMKNNLFSFSEIYGPEGVHLREIIRNTESPMEKSGIVQQFLVQKLRRSKKNNQLIDYLVQHIRLLPESTSIRELERFTGYSARYLELLFRDHLGITPKTLISICRFQKFYKLVNEFKMPGLEKGNIYDFYYDQAHFIKEFKRYTGLTPTQYSKFQNDFGKIF